MSDVARCELCGEPMPPGEQMFKFHGYSGNCPKPPLPKPPSELETLRAQAERMAEALERLLAVTGPTGSIDYKAFKDCYAILAAYRSTTQEGK